MTSRRSLHVLPYAVLLAGVLLPAAPSVRAGNKDYPIRPVDFTKVHVTDAFFYPNPLESDGKFIFNEGSATRKPWFECACCPGNLVRFLPSVPGYVYAVGDDALYVNLFIGSSATIEIGGRPVNIEQETRYPWDGKVRISVDPGQAARFALNVRIPGWVLGRPVPSDLYRYEDAAADRTGPGGAGAGIMLKVNGEAVPLDMKMGYAVVRREWKKGDLAELSLPMPVRRVLANPAVTADAGRVALERGPIVYCVESADNGGRALDLALPDSSRLEAGFRPGFMNGIVVITGKAVATAPSSDGKSSISKDREFVAIPYYAWSNRGVGEMAVWLPRKAS